MRPRNTYESLISSTNSFLYVDGPDIEYTRRIFKGEDQKAVRRPRQEDIRVTYFLQLWGSTALGFRGMGGATMTHAYTTVINHEELAYVYFGGMFAYKCKWDEVFESHVAKRRVPGKTEENFKKLTLMETPSTLGDSKK